MDIKYLIKVSRPRFWLYLAGPVLIAGAAINDLQVFLDYWFYILFLYFLIPANIYLYGINDYFDFDTDKFNIKKEEKETRLENEKKRKLVRLYIYCFLFFSAFLAIFIPQSTSIILFIVFLFLATYYSAPPFRFKRYPIVDSVSNVLYILPGLVFYSLYNNDFNLLIIFSLWAWTIAMHLFSAILDIEPDKKAGLKTSAVLFGEKTSLWICVFLWSFFALAIIYSNLLSPLSYLFLIYPVIPLFLIIKKRKASQVYWYFPFITGILGFLSFWYLIII